MKVMQELQQVSKLEALEAVKKRLPEESTWLFADHFDYYAYPQVFGNTAGPFGGIGGQAMTTFTIEAWVCNNVAVLFCGKKILKVTDKWEGPQTVRV